MNKNMYYEENRNLEEEDVGYDSPIYNITIFDKHFLLTIGKERKLLTKKNRYYFPVYIMNKLQVQCQIGAFEFESTKDTQEERWKPFRDSSGDIDLNRLGDIIFYSFADYDYFQNINIDITLSIISDMETKYAEQMINEEIEEEQNKETVELEVFELDENDIKITKSMLKTEKVLKNGVFELDKSVKLPSILVEETKEQYDLAVSNHIQAWKFIFECLCLDIENKESVKGLTNPDSMITKSILFLYSMETFLPY